MSPFIFHLPPELSEMIISRLSKPDLCRVSATCKRYREKLAPHIFHTISFENDERTSSSALAAVKIHGNLVRCLKFDCWAEPHDAGVEELPLLESPELLPAACKLLRGSPTPNSDGLAVRFIYCSIENNLFWDGDYGEAYLSEAHPVEAAEAEQRCRWRAALDETYTAIAQNMRVRELEIGSLPPVRVSALSTPLFGKMLGRLKSATLGLCNPWLFSDYGPHPGLVPDTREELFAHMTELECLHLVGSRDYFPGPRWPIPNVYPQTPRINLPMLRTLSLNQIYFLSPGLVEFLEAHAATLSVVTLIGCMAGFKGARPSETWANFFSQINALKLPALVKFCVSYESEHLIGEPLDYETSLSKVQAKRIAAEKLKSDPAKDSKRRVFAYTQ